ncbi:MAG: UPF0104 family protein [Anaerolineae bacterium]|nr:MAG: UPF0104 family protein [Anaerolineae bacterium]
MSEATATRGRVWARMLPGLLISGVVLAVLFRLFDWRDVVTALRQGDPRFLLAALPFYLLSYLMRALAWRTILREAVPLWDVFLTMHSGYLLNNVLPFRLGEVGRAYLLGRRLGFWRVFPTILIERAFDMILAASLLLGTLPFVLVDSDAGGTAVVVGAVVLLGLLAFYLLARYREWALSTFERLGARWPVVLRVGRERLAAFITGLGALTSPTRFLCVLFWMLFSWMMAVMVQWMVLRAFYPAAVPLHAAFALAVSALGVAVPSSPGYIGVFEAAVVGALAAFDIPFATAFADAVMLHLFYVAVTGSFGLYGLARSGVRLGEIFERLQQMRGKE